MKVRIKENSWIAKLAAAKLKSQQVALVIGHTIHLYNTSREAFLADPQWVCHELKHVLQYRQYGVPGFLFRYITDCARNGYYNSRFEKEARGEENNLSLLKEVVFC